MVCVLHFLLFGFGWSKQIIKLKSSIWLIILYTWIKSPLNLLYFKVGKSSFFSFSVQLKSLKVLTNLEALLLALSIVTDCFSNRESILHYHTLNEVELGLCRGCWIFFYQTLNHQSDQLFFILGLSYLWIFCTLKWANKALSISLCSSSPLSYLPV